MGLLSGKTALVTGAARGIGKAVAMKFASEGANIAFTDLVLNDDMAAGLEATRKEIEALGVTCRAYAGNAADFEETQKTVKQIHEDFGSIDILVNNAGICKLNKVLDFGRADWDPMIDVNLTAAFELSYEAAKIMIPQKSGKIINICSLFSYLGGQWSPAYSATKHALAGFTKAYCDELGQYNIQVNGIAPGYYATDITLATRSNPETNQRVLDHIPANRWGDTQDLMGAAVFLASQASNYVNGHLLVVDGGYLVR